MDGDDCDDEDDETEKDNERCLLMKKTIMMTVSVTMVNIIMTLTLRMNVM